MKRILLVHGWGYDPAFWQPLIRELSPYRCQCTDLGYFGNLDLTVELGNYDLAVGHSMGFLWLLAHCRRDQLKGLVAINAFTRFVQEEDFPQGVPLRILTSMKKNVARNPAKTLADFHAAAGFIPPDQGTPRVDRLKEGLRYLGVLDGRQAFAAWKKPFVALATGDDAIVPAAMSEALFPPKVLRLRADGGHVLPVSHPQWCAERIRKVMDKID